MPLRPPALLALLAARCAPVAPDDTEAEPPRPPANGLRAVADDPVGALVRVTWEQEEECLGAVGFRVDGEDWRASPAAARPVGAREQLLVGLPFDADAEVRLEQDCGAGPLVSEVLAVRTGAVPSGLPDPAVLFRDEAAGDPDLRYLLLSTDSREDAFDPRAGWTAIVDRDGRLVWALPTPEGRVTMAARVAADRDGLLIDHNSFWGIFDAGAASEVVRVGLDGRETARHPTPGLHHALAELPDGTLAWGAAGGSSETLELLAPGGTQKRLWNCASLMLQVGSMTFCSANTLTYDPATDAFVFSFFSTDTVAEIDATTGETRRWFGQLEGAWAFDPPESAFWWQHGANYTPQGTLLLSAREADHTEVTVVREYALDEEASTLRQVFTWGADEGLYGDELGEAWRLPNGNTLHNLGTAMRVREITPDGRLAWDLGWTRGSLLGRTEPIDDLFALLPDGGAR